MDPRRADGPIHGDAEVVVIRRRRGGGLGSKGRMAANETSPSTLVPNKDVSGHEGTGHG